MKHEALRRISTCYTTDLGNLHTHADDCDDPCKCPISWEVGDCIGVLHLARQLGLGLLVPAALYRCANDVPIERTFQTSAGQAQLPMLGFRELEDCVRSRDDLMLESVRLYGMFSNLQPSPGCLQVAKKGTLWGKKDVGCLQVLKTMIASAEGRNFCGPLTLFRAETYITSHTEPIPSGSFCAPCGEHFKSLHAQQREEIWSRFCEKYGNSYHSVSLQYFYRLHYLNLLITALLLCLRAKQTRLKTPRRPRLTPEFHIPSPVLVKLNVFMLTSLNILQVQLFLISRT